MVTKKVYSSIDLFKFIASIMVVAIHTHPLEGMVADYYFTCFCRIAVPFFFVASSYFFFSRPEPDIKRYLYRLGTLYLLWFILELPFVYYKFFVDFKYSFPLQLLNFFRSLFFSNTWWASWYIMASMISVVIVYYLDKRCKLKNSTLLILAIVGYLFSLSSAGYGGFVDLFLSERMQFNHRLFVGVFCPSNSFVVALIYVVLGKILSETKWERWNIVHYKWQLVLLWFGILFFGVMEVFLMKWSMWVSDAWCFLPPLTLVGFVILLLTDTEIKPDIAQLMRKMSILIYILHPIFQFVNGILFSMENGFFMFLITSGECIVLSYSIISLSPKAPLLKKLY